MNYYNENDPFAAAWLKNLIALDLIADGVVDDRSIVDVQPSDLAGFRQCHFFAGVGGWSLALRLAGVPDDEPIWTGSCPCQPFSAAGKRKGTADERHLWPEMYRLVAACKPERIFGEQVEAAIRLGWIDGVFADLAREDYACGFVVLGAHSVGAPHIRQRIYWMADAERDTGDSRRLADLDGESTGAPSAGPCAELGRRGVPGGGMGDTDAARSQGRSQRSDERTNQRTPWSSGVFIPCADGKVRRVEPGIQPLAHGVSARVGKLRAAGNAIVPQVAAEFIRATMQ